MLRYIPCNFWLFLRPLRDGSNQYGECTGGLSENWTVLGSGNADESKMSNQMGTTLKEATSRVTKNITPAWKPGRIVSEQTAKFKFGQLTCVSVCSLTNSKLQVLMCFPSTIQAISSKKFKM